MSNPETVQTETKMTNPPVTETKMIGTQKKGQKLYKVVALREFNVGEPVFKNGMVVMDTTRRIKVGEVVEVPKAIARDLCNKITGAYAFSGERYEKDGGNIRHDLTRARLATEADFVKQGPLTPLDNDDILGD